MKITNKIWVLCLMALPFALQSCEDYFDTDPQNIVNEEDYIAEEDEMYKGFLGILNRMQAAGDHSIFLTDTRLALLETTPNAPTELKSIYNYGITDGNSYADPTCYYAIIVACNDYFHKMEQFYKNVGGMTEYAEANYKPLLSAAMRIKAWAYLMLGKTYGEAYWFDDSLTEKHELTDTDIFTHCNMKELADKAIDLLENGMLIGGEQVPANLNVSWVKWLDPENQDATLYQKWEFLTPPSLLLNAEFRSWRASYVDEAAAQADWTWIRNSILDFMYGYLEGTNENAAKLLVGEQGTNDIYQLNIKLQSDMPTAYFRIFFSEEVGLKTQVISSIMYDYLYEQRNRLVQYFCPEYPDAESYYLKPSEYGKSLYTSSDIRGIEQKWVMNTLAGSECVSKYYYGYNDVERKYEYLNKLPIYKIQPSIPTFRGHDLHFLLAEAEAHLGNFVMASAILNDGFSTLVPSKVFPTDWDIRYYPWVIASKGGYANAGIAGAAVGQNHELPIPTAAELASYTEEQLDALKQQYDWALADEHIKEYLAEGKSHGYLCKIAERYANSAYRGGSAEIARDSVAKRIAPKYEGGTRTQVENDIKSNGYFINWNLTNL